MRRILILVAFVLIGGGLYANNGKALAEKEGKQVVNDTTKKGVSGKIDLQKMLQAAAASGQKPRIMLTQNITPVNVSSTNKHVKVETYVIKDTMCMVRLDVTGCKGKLTGIDTSAYMVVGEPGNVYKIKSVKEAKLPVNAKEAMTWDSKKTNMITLVFPKIKMISGKWDWEVVLSTAKNGERLKTTFQR